MKPFQKFLKIVRLAYADFSVMYGHKAMYDPLYDKNKTGNVIMVANCPIM